MESDPSVIRESNFTIGTTITHPGEPQYWFGYLGENLDSWSACPAGNNEWKLFFGKLNGNAPTDGCTENFSLEVKYTAGNPPHY